jgi:hypothetical protein
MNSLANYTKPKDQSTNQNLEHKLKTIINLASKQIPKGLKVACTDSLEIKSKELLKKENIYLYEGSQKEKAIFKDLIAKEQTRIIKKYFKKGNSKDSKGVSIQEQEAALRTACFLNNTKVLKSLLTLGVSPLMPTQDKWGDLIHNKTPLIAKTLLEFYKIDDLKALIEKDLYKKKNPEKISTHNPYKNFPQEWIITLAKKELTKKVLENANKSRTINLEI